MAIDVFGLQPLTNALQSNTAAIKASQNSVGQRLTAITEQLKTIIQQQADAVAPRDELISLLTKLTEPAPPAEVVIPDDVVQGILDKTEQLSAAEAGAAESNPSTSE